MSGILPFYTSLSTVVELLFCWQAVMIAAKGELIMRTILFWLVIGGVAAAETPRHRAEVLYEGMVSRARDEYEAKLQEAAENLKVAMERAAADATKRGETAKATAYRERAAMTARFDGTPISGTYAVTYPQGFHDCIFSADGISVQMTTSSGTKNMERPRLGRVYWSQNGEIMVGFVTWHGGTVPVEVFYVTKEKIITRALLAGEQGGAVKVE